jgi:hypothetical protein
MSDQERLRSALHASVDGIEPAAASGDGLEALRGRAHKARQRRAAVLGGGGVAVLALLVASVVFLARDHDGHVTTGPAGQDTTTTVEDTTTSSVPTTSTTPTTTTPPITPDFSYVFPTDVGGRQFHDPEALVRAFVTDYVGLDNPVVHQTGAHDVEVRGHDPNGTVGHVRSTVHVEEAAGQWYVTSAQSANVTIDEPGGPIASPVTATGKGTGYEGNIVVEVRDTDGRKLGVEPTIAGSMGEVAPYEIAVSFSSPSGPTGGLVAHNDSGLEGIVDFGVVPVAFASGGTSGTTVKVFYTANSGGVAAFTRTVSKTTGVLKAAIEQELLGPQPAEGDVTSFFSSDTAGMLAGVSIANGVAVVDFDPALATTIPNASSSAGSQKLVAELDATVFQFPTVTAVEYRLGGSCDAFWSWLQGQCHQETR